MTRSGALPLLPGQAMFMTELYPQLLNPNRWSLARLFRLPAGQRCEPVRASVRDIWRRHEALRISMVRTPDGWAQRVADEDTPEPFRFLDLSRVPVPDQRAEIERLAIEAHSTLSLESGPMARFIFLHLGAGESGRLLFLVHHLAADGLSFAVLQSELDSRIRAHSTGRPAVAPRGAPYRDCVEAMVDYAGSAELTGELEHWRAQPWSDCVELPRDFPAHTPDSVRSWRTVRCPLRGAPAWALAQSLPVKLGMDLADILLAAVAETITTWSGGPLCVRAVHHGRTLRRSAAEPDEAADPGTGERRRTPELDLARDLAARRPVPVLPRRAARTVGWLSTFGCLIVRPRTEADPGEYLIRVRDLATAAPNRGAGLSLLRWTTGPGEHTDLITQAWRSAQIMFNFGALGGVPADDEVLGVADEAVGHRADPMEPRLTLHIRAHRAGDEVVLMWDFDPSQHHRKAVAALADQCRQTLVGYVDALG